MSEQKIVPVIISGGVGSRLWPVSRETEPKPFLCIQGESLIQKALARSSLLPHVTEVITVTNKDLCLKTLGEYNKVDRALHHHFILEPVARNTAPAIALAALYAAEKFGNDTILLVSPADHLIADTSAFTKNVSRAAELAQQGKLVTFGVKPTHPETGYGYIHHKDNTVLRFVEKPDLETAQKYMTTGEHLWNAGIFCFTAGTFISEMTKFEPQMMEALQAIVKTTKADDAAHLSKLLISEPQFAPIKNISIDYALMEKSSCVAVVPCDFVWSDVGSWDSLHRALEKDDQSNYIAGNVIASDTSNCYIHSENRLVAAVGVKGLSIIDTADCVLVCDNQNAQNVRTIFETLKKADNDLIRHPRTVTRPWGSYTVLEEGVGYKVKHIEVYPKASLSLQLHYHRQEHWVVIHGQARVTNADHVFDLNVGEDTFIPKETKHRLENPGDTPLIIIEVQNGDYVGEDDIVRFDDVYGRIA